MVELNKNELSDEWKDGLKKEKIVAALTDEILRKYGIPVQRTNNKKDQYNGIDFRIKYPDEKATRCYDEKEAVSCYDRDLQTYTIELYHHAHVNHRGWFNGEMHGTTHYLFGYVRADDAELHHIYRWEGLFINKALLKQYVSYLGNLMDDIEEFLDWDKISNKKDFVYTLYYNNESDFAKLIFSKKFEKNVINLMLPKAMLIKMSRRRIIWEEKDGKTAGYFETNCAEIPESTLESLREYQARYDDMINDLRRKLKKNATVS